MNHFCKVDNSIPASYQKIIYILCMITLCIGCQEDKPKDWSEIVILYVSAETGTYNPWGIDEVLEGMKIRESQTDTWNVVHFKTIEGFSYEKGYSYSLKVEKTHLVNPPADGSNIRYKLIEILSKE